MAVSHLVIGPADRYQKDEGQSPITPGLEVAPTGPDDHCDQTAAEGHPEKERRSERIIGQDTGSEPRQHRYKRPMPRRIRVRGGAGWRMVSHECEM